MPIYEYVCLECKTRFEALRSMREADAPIRCKTCDSEHTSRAISVFAAHGDRGPLAGSGSGCTTCSTHTCSTCSTR